MLFRYQPKRLLLRFILLSFGIAATGPVPAQEQAGECTEPEQPYCIYDSATYASQETYNACKQRVDAFTKTHEQYVACLKQNFETEMQALQRSQQDELNAAIDRGNIVVDRFNCLQKEQGDCY